MIERGLAGVWSMKIRKILTVIVGIIQSITAASIVIFACFIYLNLFDVQTWLNAATEFYHVHLLALLVFGFFSIISGLLLIQEWSESR